MSPSSTALLRACALLLCLVAGSLQLTIKEFSVPKSVEFGGHAELRCEYELEPGESEVALYVKWWWKPNATSTDRRLIYQRIEGHAAESIHHSDSSHIEIRDKDTIVLKDLTPVDSGTYECEVSNIEEMRSHGQLVVYNMGLGPKVNISQMETSSDSEKPLLLVECEAHDVAPKPELSVTIDGRSMNMTTIIDDEDDDGLYYLYANATLCTGNENTREIEVRCEIFFSDENVAHPPYVDVKTYTPAGFDKHATTELPEDTTEPEATPESLHNSRDGGIRLHSSWLLLTVAAATHLQTIL